MLIMPNAVLVYHHSREAKIIIHKKSLKETWAEKHPATAAITLIIHQNIRGKCGGVKAATNLRPVAAKKE